MAMSRSFREKPGAERAGGAARERRVAGGLDSVGDLGSAQNKGGRESREKRERERKRFDRVKIQFFSKFSFETWKTLNMKVVENFEFYTFRFRHKFV